MNNIDIYEFLQEGNPIVTNSNYNNSIEIANSVNSKTGTIKTIEEKDVNFYDYDGTILYSYSKDDFLKLSEMPNNPSHDGLIAQGWNWNFEDSQSYVEKYGILDVGQMYVTDDGTTRLYIDIDEFHLNIQLHIPFDYGSSLEIDWGDGSEVEEITELSPQHEYNDPGKYIVAIKNSLNNNNIYLAGTAQDNISSIVKVMDSGGLYDYSAALFKIEIGNNVVLSKCAFNQCCNLKMITCPSDLTINNNVYSCFEFTGLKSLTLPNSLTLIPEQFFAHAYKMETIIMPNEIQEIGAAAFWDNFSLKRIVIPESCDSIGGSAFMDCHNLTTLILPENIESLGDLSLSADSYDENFFMNCYSLKTVKLYTSSSYIESSPAIANSFSGTVKNCIVFECPLISIPHYSALISNINSSNSHVQTIGYSNFSKDEDLPNLFDGNILTWFASKKDLIENTNIITKGTGEKIYCIWGPDTED